MAQTVGTCVLNNCDKLTCLLQALAQINRVFPTAVSPTKTHFTNSWCGCSLSILPSLCKLSPLNHPEDDNKNQKKNQINVIIKSNTIISRSFVGSAECQKIVNIRH